MKWAWTKIHEYCEYHEVQTVIVKGSAVEATLITQWIQLAVEQETLKYRIEATGETTSMIPPKRRVPESLTPLVKAVRVTRPEHVHISSAADGKPSEKDYLHCSALEVLYYTIYYTPGEKRGTEIPVIGSECVPEPRRRRYDS